MFPLQSAHVPPRKKRRVVAVRYPVWSSYCPQVLEGIVSYMRENEAWQLVTENDSYGEMAPVTLDENWRGDGIILFRATEQELEAFRKNGVAVVLTSTEGPDGGFPRVVPDNLEIGRRAAAHLVECAVRHFAFLARGETFYREPQFAPGIRRYARQRLKGFRDELRRYAIEPHVHYLKGRPLWKPTSWQEIQAEVMSFLETLPPQTGLFVVDDALATVVLRAADALGITIPESLAVVGFGNDLIYCYSTLPALSTTPFPGFEIGRNAARILHQQMLGGKTAIPSLTVPVADVVQRDSTDVLAIPDEHIRKIVRHIRLTAPRDPIRVSELPQLSPLSLTTIKALFAQYLGHSPKQEIQRVRLQHLTHLLAHTDLSLAEIAEQMRFSSVHELSRFFFSKTGKRPSEYREERRRSEPVPFPAGTVGQPENGHRKSNADQEEKNPEIHSMPLEDLTGEDEMPVANGVKQPAKKHRSPRKGKARDDRKKRKQSVATDFRDHFQRKVHVRDIERG